MVVIDDYSQYKYTRIIATITLDECSADRYNERHYVDVNLDTYIQDQCFIGDQYIEKLSVDKVFNGDERTPQWTISIVVSRCLLEPEIHVLLNKYCDTISLICSKQLSLQNYGFKGFSFRLFDVCRQYSEDGVRYSDYDLPTIGEVDMSTTTTITHNIFTMPQSQVCLSPLMTQFREAYMIALRSTDIVARYILSYYIFEIIFGTAEWLQYVANAKAHKTSNHWKAEALSEYIKQEFSVHEYTWFGRKNTLSADILEQIINVRNDLTHRSDQSQIARMLYPHLIPILQAILSTE